MHTWSPAVILAAALLILPFLAMAFAGDSVARAANRLPTLARLLVPSLLAVLVYALVSTHTRMFQWQFCIIYFVLPFGLVLLLWHAAQADPEQHSNWRDYAVLAVLGVVVEFHLLEMAWPRRLGGFNRLILLDTGLFGFLCVRQLTNVGFHFVPRWSDVKTGLRELAFYAPIAIPLGIALHFLHAHVYLPSLWRFVSAWFSIFVFVAILEETYFRGWIQNLLERRLGPNGALIVTAVLFGLSHFNKGLTAFNWRYVLLATLAGIFYGRAWRQNHRLMASAITHASVDTIWLLWFH